ncbi:unnamed protein product [Mytilus edulis]|uniref:Reverse transcriptase domain-containing protein n=1 Tax=Mytilus edulis TaxID=6550 RepID=A0A8S3RHW3_MYTED|nr:unnamed protein product [Mytilus edulis]
MFKFYNTPDNFIGGQISVFIQNWNLLTLDKWIRNVLTGYTIELDNIPFQNTIPKTIEFNEHESDLIQKEIEKFLRKEIIEKVSNTCNDTHGYYSNIFIRPKKDGSVRVILNLKSFNDNVVKKHFKMETLHTAINNIKLNQFMASVDLKDAYYSVPIQESDKKYLRFRWKNDHYQFKVLPQGLSSSPRVFTKLLKPVYGKLREMGHVNVPYIDDSLLLGDTYHECLKNIEDTVTLLDGLGFTIHPEKSVFLPTQEIVFLGFIINTLNMTLQLTPERKKSLIEQCKLLLYQKKVTIRDLARVIGKMVASEPGVKYAPLYFKDLEHFKDKSLKGNQGNFDAIIELDIKSKELLHWWIDNIMSSCKSMTISQPSVIFYSDASKTGWGGFNKTYQLTDNGFWTHDEIFEHINFLELKAALLTLQSLGHMLHDTHIRLYVDNTVAVSYIHNFGGRIPSLHNLTKEIWHWCVDRNIWLSVAHIPGKDNVTADKLSRKLNEDMEWMLKPEVFEIIEQVFDKITVDLFASGLNKQKQRYVSFLPDSSGKSAAEVNYRQSQQSIDCSTNLDNSSMVSNSSTTDLSTTILTTTKKFNISRKSTKTTSSEKSSTWDFLCVREHLQSKGVSNNVADIILQSWRSSTSQQYKSYLKKWKLFSSEREINLFDPPTEVILEFLNSLFEQNVGYSGINTAKSAISALCSLVSNRNIGKETLVKRFMKGVFTKKPSLPKYSKIWDVNKVLTYFDKISDNEQLSLLELSQKLAMLFMLLSGQRCQTIYKLELDNVQIEGDTMVAYVSELLKQTKPGVHMKPLVFDRYIINEKLCILRTYEEYVRKTETLRNNEQKVFISTIKPYKSVTKSTIARWVKTVMKSSGINIECFGPHSCRSASTSAALSQGLKIDTIMKSAGWQSAKTFQKFYNKTIIIETENNFAQKILPSSN